MELRIHVKPGSRKNELIVLQDGTILVKISAPPVDGKANKALIGFLAGFFEVSKSSVEILKGETGRHKKIRIIGEEKKLNSLFSSKRK